MLQASHCWEIQHTDSKAELPGKTLKNSSDMGDASIFKFVGKSKDVQARQ